MELIRTARRAGIGNPIFRVPTVASSATAAIAWAAVAAGALLSGCQKASKAAPVPSGSSLAAASGAAPTTFPPTAIAPRTAADTRPVLVCFGDSLTAGLGVDPSASYPADLQRLLDAQGYPYHVLNAGISGNTTKDGLDRIQLILAQHPQIVVVEFGGNDGLRGLPIQQTQANLSSIIAQLQHGGARVALAGITLPPDYGPDYIRSFNAMYPALARRYHVPLLPFLLRNVYGIPGDMQDDATHPTTQGDLQVALNVEALLHPLLRK